ncbi:unnamed protein product [Rotaria magnacalcarata]|uniref:Uncharacterized protein n=4 Tax=Rotaria magnacalcarata TaxID=392030 RepID=A0A819IUK5_9BILA|nr:unnamed protein product [Rotaria magnacalcarata]
MFPYMNFEEQVDGETLFYMNDLDLLKPFKLSYKNQIIFLKERAKLFLSKINQETPKPTSTSSDKPLLIIDENEAEVLEEENEAEVLEDENGLIQSAVNVSSSITIKPTKYLDSSYPTRAQYAIIVVGILNHLGVERDSKNVDSWRESLISKYKRERQNLSDDKVIEMKHRYSKVNSGRKIKGFPVTQMSERNSLKTIAIVKYTSNDSEQMKAKAEIINKNFLNNSFDDEVFKQLWAETHEYRQSFIKQHTTADIMEQFSVYSNPSMVLEDVKILTSVDLDNSVKERMDVLSSKICSDNQFPTDNPSIRCFKVLCSILNDSWKHYICFYPEKPATPQPTIVVEDDNIKIYCDWTFICSSNSIEQSLAVLVGLYSLMNLKFHAYRAAVRFLYAYFLNDKQQQSNSIRRFCKEYNIELQSKPSASLNQLATKTNNNTLDPDELENSDHNSIIDSEEKNTAIIHDEDQTSLTIFVPNNPRPASKRKADQLIDPQNIDKENAPTTKRPTRSTNRKRC